MPRYNRKEDFEFGLAQIAPFFGSLGFSLHRGQPYSDRAGTSHSARFVRTPRSVDVNHLYSLGPIIYSIRAFSVEHTFYIEALGLTAAPQFPCFADDSISGYPALLHDLQNLLTPFFAGPEDDFIAIAKRYMQLQKQQHADGSRDLTYHAATEHSESHMTTHFDQSGLAKKEEGIFKNIMQEFIANGYSAIQRDQRG